MRVQVFQHVPYEGLGTIVSWLKEHHFDISVTRFFEDASPPRSIDYDWLIILGGPMNIDESGKYSWMPEEMAAIERSIQAGKIVFGICLGAQLIASVLGAKIYKNPEIEIGWYPVVLSEKAQNHRLFGRFPPEFTVFHWHGDTFDIPKTAIKLAGSAACENQGFLYDESILGLQFHMETTEISTRNLISNSLNDLVPAKYIQRPEFMLSQSHLFHENNRLMDKLLDHLLEISK